MRERTRELLAANKARLEATEAERRSGTKLDEDAMRELARLHKATIDSLDEDVPAKGDLEALRALSARAKEKLKMIEAERNASKKKEEIRERLRPILGDDIGFDPDPGGDPSKFVLKVDLSLFMDAGLLSRDELEEMAKQGDEAIKRIEEAAFVLSNSDYFLQTLTSRRFWFVDGRPNHEALAKQLRKDFGQDKFGDFGEFGPLRQLRLFPLVYRYFERRSDEKAGSAAATGSAGEHRAQKLFEAMGYHATRSPDGPDQGVDLVLEKDGQRSVVQVKNYSEPVGNAAVQEAIAGREFLGAAGAFVVSFSGFTNSAEELARSTRTSLIDFRSIERQFGRMVK